MLTCALADNGEPPPPQHLQLWQHEPPPFWQFPPMLLTGSAAAGGIALINSIGSFSGVVAPFAVGWLTDITGKTTTGPYGVAVL